MRIVTPSAVGDNNKYAILDLIQSRDGIGREEIARTLSLSAPAVSKNVNVLLETGIIFGNGTSETQMGRKPVLLYYNSGLQYVLGVEVMPQGIRAALADLSGEILFWEEAPSNVHSSVDAILESIDQTIQKLLDRRPADRPVTSICIATPGFTGHKSAYNLLSVYQKNWETIDLAGRVEERFQIPTTVMNDVELDLLGECWRGAGTAYENILLVKYGDGFACRYLINGELFRGSHFAAGEIGHCIFGMEQVTKRAVSPGVLEQYLCHDVFREYQSAIAAGESPKRIDLSHLIGQGEEGDSVAEQYILKIIDTIAVIVCNTALVLNPQLVILAGGAERFRPEDMARVQQVLEGVCYFPPEVCKAKLGRDSTLYGGIRVALNHANDKLVELWK